jgi:hypothetical protein
MKIIFDEKAMYKVHFNEITENVDAKTAKARANKIVKCFCNAMEDMGKFIGADEVHYEDMHKKGRYIIIKGNQKLTLIVSGNNWDGGYMVSSVTKI